MIMYKKLIVVQMNEHECANKYTVIVIYLKKRRGQTCLRTNVLDLHS
jgi:hypothetical protein